MNAAWGVKWVLGKEVFTAPDGTEWLRTDSEHAELCVLVRTAGLSSMYLKRGSSAHIVRVALRKARRLARRTKRLHKENV